MELEDQDSELLAFDALMQELKNCEQNKADGYGALIKTWEAEAEAFSVEIKRMETQKKARLNKIERLKDNLELYMQTLKIDRIDGSLFKLVMQNNPESVEITDESIIPDHLCVISKRPDKVALKNLLKQGYEVKGSKLVQTQSVRIK